MGKSISDSYISYFTPSEMTPETLEFIFVKREKLATRLVDRVRESVLTSAKYQSILIGPRGIGKSHMVALVYHRVKTHTELENKVAIAWLAEEEWGVGSLVDFYFVILEALEREYGGLREQIDTVYDLPDSQRTDATGNLIRTFVGDRILFLLVENLEDIFRGLSRDELWTLRSFLSKTPFATVLATTPSLFNAINRQNEAFFGFFQPSYLDELSVEEATELLEKLAERRGDTGLTNFLKTPTAQDRVHAVHELAGGHPRLYLLFAHLLTQTNLEELVTPFLEFLDELTPYFQDRMKGLSPQQRKIVTFLCDRRGAAAVKEIVARTNGMSSQTVSGQLDKLEEMGYVRKTRVGRESHYELREPLLRMIVEKKRGRGEPIRLVVDFLRRWYSRDERRDRLTRSVGKDIHYWQASLDLSRAVQDTPDPSRAKELSSEFWEAREQKNYTRAAEIAAEIIERKGRSCNANDWFWYAWCLDETGDYQKSVESYNQTIKLNPMYAAAWNNRGYALNNLSRYEEALESYDKVIELDPRYAAAWVSRGYTLNHLSRYREALEDLNQTIKLTPRYATAWNNRGYALNNLSRYEEALESYDKAIELDPKYATAWVSRGYTLDNLSRYEEALESYDKAIELDPKYAAAWCGRGYTLDNLSRYEEALKNFNRAIELDSKDAIIWISRGYTLNNLSRFDEALDNYKRAIELDPKNARPWFHLGKIHLYRNQWNEFQKSLKDGLTVALHSDIRAWDADAYCRILLQQNWSDERQKTADLISLYANYNAVGILGQGLTESIPTLIAPDITQARAEAWRDTWEKAGADQPDLVVPLRLLSAAVAWKPAHDVRALLALAIEERRVLERLLEEGEESAQ